MRHDPISSTDPEAWIEQTFDVPAVRNGGILRTSLRAVNTGAGMERFKAEVNRRKFRAVENNGHIIVFCNMQPVEIIASGPGPSGGGKANGG